MSNTSELLAPLTAAGLSVRVVDGNRLAIEPAARLNHDLRQHVRQYKSELLALLAANDPPQRQSAGLSFRLLAGGGGSVIDHEGACSAVDDLRGRYGKRLDWRHLAGELHRIAPDDADALALVDELAESQAEMLGRAGYD